MNERWETVPLYKKVVNNRTYTLELWNSGWCLDGIYVGESLGIADSKTTPLMAKRIATKRIREHLKANYAKRPSQRLEENGI
jgi:hypothetical protein